jgi:fumarylacetoacetate (FAA) hydrolase
MKLASLRSGRDGKLIIASRSLKRAVLVSEIAETLQDALDEWTSTEPLLHEIARDLDAGRLPDAFDLDPTACVQSILFSVYLDAVKCSQIISP